jgi:ribosome-binding factor A
MPAAELSLDDLQNALDFFKKPSRQKSDRKLQQLCRQVQRALMLAMGGGQCADPFLQDLVVESVVPAPDATRLMVGVSIAPSARSAEIRLADRYEALADLLGRLERATPALRREVATAITRKRAPELAFQLVGPSEGQP